MQYLSTTLSIATVQNFTTQPEDVTMQNWTIFPSALTMQSFAIFPSTATFQNSTSDETMQNFNTSTGMVENFTVSSNTTGLNNSSDTSVSKPPLDKYYPFIAAEMALSIACLLLLIATYVRILEHRTGPGKNVLSLACCLLINYLFLIVDLTTRGRIAQTTCTAMSYTIHFTFLATFLWTNVMAYDIMITMASIKPNISLQARSSRYWKYSLYAWTLTLLCSVPAYVIDHWQLVPLFYRPKFGQNRCWLSGTPAFLLYFNAPVGVILLSNCILFAITARTIVRVKNAAAILEARQHKRRFRLYVKLVLVMGLVWITEFIPWATGYHKLYALAGALNSLHGVFMFLIFACKKRIWKEVKETCTCFKFSKHPAGRQVQSSSLVTITTTSSILSRT